MQKPTRSRGAGIVLVLGAWLALGSGLALGAEDVIVASPIAKLKLVDGALPPGPATRPLSDVTHFERGDGQFEQTPYVVLAGPGEAYLDQAMPADNAARQRWMNRSYSLLTHIYPDDILAARIPSGHEGKAITGRLVVPAEKGMVALKFVMPADRTTPEAARAFAEAKQRHFDALLWRGVPGAPWFRVQIRDAMARLPHEAGETPQRVYRSGFVNDSRTITSLDQTYALFSGGRAISENLQFDRPLIPRGGMTSGVVPDQPQPPSMVKLDTLAGISVAAINWEQKLAGKQPEVDPLARGIPADQHALFLPSLAAARTLLAEFQGTAIPALELTDCATEIVPVQRRYERQLGVSFADLDYFFLSKRGDKAGIRSLAVTGSDPYFATGTDLALLFEVRDPATLAHVLRQRMEGACHRSGQDVSVVEEDRDGVKLWVARTPDRSLSSYLTVEGGVVVLSNSRWQIEQVSKALRGRLPRLADAPEYRFFRDRYPRDAAGGTGFIVLTDATIRRWCGPRWRIASSRRVRAASLLASLHADHLEELAFARAKTGEIASPGFMKYDPSYFDPGHLRMSKTGVFSDIYGSVLFPTPIAEIPLDEVTRGEATTYEAWRNSYQMNWRNYFDPIAIRLGADPGKRVSADLTVMPLIAGTDYKWMIDLVGKSKIAPGDGDPHPGTLLHAVLALDVNSAIMKRGGQQLSAMTRIPQQLALSWLGHTAAIYVDEDPFLAELAKHGDFDNFLIRNLDKLPLGLHVQVTDGARLALFLGAVRGFLEQSAPDLLVYETREHNGRHYVRAGDKRPEAHGGPDGGFALYYAATPHALVVSPNEKVVTRFLDRLDAAEGKGHAQADRRPAQPAERWLGESLAVQARTNGFQLLAFESQSAIGQMPRRQCWANLPLLNEYHRLFPDRDPVQMHEDLWGVRLTCPGGGRYVWNETWGTMESTAFGCPAAPRPGPETLGVLKNLRAGQFGLTFKDQGLRARVAIDLAPSP
ncbi:MAG: hypothetical protein ACP5XB_05060 [Isosphaeraceae bacterium]